MPSLERNPEVVTTELEEGAVLLNMATGFYYSLNPSGAEIWRRLDVDPRAEELTELLRQRFQVEPERAATAASSFVAALAREGLVAQRDDSPAPADPTPAAPGERRPFAEPELVKHDEPMHEVSMSPFDPQLPLAE
jgi:Coenzyme PQQ synthesis protein D (PqqD)